MKHLPNYSLILMKELKNRKLSNSQYSLRAYARDLNVHPSVLSLAMKGKRTLTQKDSATIIEKLQLQGEQKILFIESQAANDLKIDKIKVPTNVQKRLADQENGSQSQLDWDVLAFLELFHLTNFEVTPVTASHKLGIRAERAKEIINLFLEKKIVIKNESGTYQKNDDFIRGSAPLKENHPLSVVSNILMAVDVHKLPEANIIVKEFGQKLMALMDEGHKTEIYKFSIQFSQIPHNLQECI